MSQDLFRSTRLVYRAVETPDDDQFFYTLLSDSIGQQNSGAAVKPVTKKAVEGYMKWLMEKAIFAVVICLPAIPDDLGNLKVKGKDCDEGFGSGKEELIPIGKIDLNPSGGAGPLGVPNMRNAEIAIDIMDGYRGKGYGTEAIKWITNWAFVSAGMHSVGVGCYAYNEGARKLYDRMGFVYQGRKREVIWINGAFHDIIEFSLLENEFKELKDKNLW